MSNMSELDAMTTWQGDNSRTDHEDGWTTYVQPIAAGAYLYAPADAAYVAHTYHNATLIHGPDFAEYRETLMGGQS